MLTKNNIKTTKTKRSNKGRPPSTAATMKGAAGSWQEVRPDKVARAKKLLQDPDYPSAKVIHSVARLMARHLSK
jgi:hypothetical protein